MNEFKYQLVNIILLGLLGTGVYWAFNTIDNGIIYDKNVVVNKEVVSKENTNTDIDKKEIVLFDNTKPEIEEAKHTTKENDVPVANKNSDLISKLQKLVDNKNTMDTGASGENVATVQKFLALYFKDKDINIDKDFGPTTKGLVKQFQEKELNGGGGNIGPNTLKAMVKWLNK